MTFPFPTMSPKRSVFATRTDLVNNISDQTSYTFTGVNIGSPGLIALIVHGGGVVSTLSGVTINGVSANILSATNLNANSKAVIAWLRVSSGTTVNIIATFSAGIKRCAISAYKITGNSNDTPVAVVAATPAGVTSLNVASGIPNGAAGLFASTVDGGTSYTWTNATKDYDVQVDTTGTMTVSAAPISNYGSLPPLTVTATVGSVIYDMCLSGAAWI